MKKLFYPGIFLCLLLVIISGCGRSSGSTPPVVVFCKADSEDYSCIYKQNLDGNGGAVRVATGHYSYPSLSPDQKKVVFTGSSRYIYVVGINHNGASLPGPLVDAGTTASVSYPAFSKDGTKIAYRMSCAETALSGIYVADAVTGVSAKIPNSPANVRHPSWSPDGSLIVYESANAIYTIYSSVTGSDTPQLLLSGAELPCWSPEDNRIAFLNATGIGLITYGGSGSVTQLIEDEESLPGYWSCDGTRLIFERYFSAQDQVDIFSVRLSDKTETNITNTTAEGESESLDTFK